MKKALSLISFAVILAAALSFSGCKKEDVSKAPAYGVATADGDNYVYLYYNEKQLKKTGANQYRITGQFIRLSFAADLDWGNINGNWKILVRDPSEGGAREVNVYDTVEGWINEGSVSIAVDKLTITGKTKKGANYSVTHTGTIGFADVGE